MNYTYYLDWATGITLFAKPRDLTTVAWATDAIELNENGSTGEYSATLDATKTYAVFEQKGLDPQETDGPPIANVPADKTLAIQAKTDLIGTINGTIATTEPTSLQLVLNKDFAATIITAPTIDSSNFVATIKRCVSNEVPSVLFNSAVGLRFVDGATTVIASDASVVRDSDTQITLAIDADAIDHLAPGEYQLDLSELTLAGGTLLLLWPP